jgi:uncharacterized protein YuzE
MQIKYSPDVDVLVIKLREGDPVDSVDISEGLIAHLAEDGGVIEIEMLDASRIVEIGELTLSGLQVAKVRAPVVATGVSASS